MDPNEPVEIEWVLRGDGSLPRIMSEMADDADRMADALDRALLTTAQIRREASAMRQARQVNSEAVSAAAAPAGQSGQSVGQTATATSLAAQQLDILKQMLVAMRRGTPGAPPAPVASLPPAASPVPSGGFVQVQQPQLPPNPLPGRGGRRMIGPYQRLAIAEQNLVAAQASGDHDRIRDAELFVKNAKTRIDRMERRPDAMGRVVRAFTSARFSVGPGGASLSPLVGETMAALGMAEVAGPVGIAIAAIVAAGQALYSFEKEVAHTTSEIAHARDVSGGSPAEQARLSSLGSIVGMGPTQMAQASRSFNERIATDPMAAGFAQQFGVSGFRGPYGTVDTARGMIQAIEGLRSIQNNDQRIIAARGMGLEEFLPLSRVSDNTMQRLRRDQEITGIVQDPEQERRAAEFQVSLARMGQASDNFKAAIAGPMMEDMTEFFNMVADILNGAAAWLSGHKELVEFIWKRMKSMMGLTNLISNPEDFLGPVASLLGLGGKSSSSSAHAELHSALMQNTAALMQNTSGVSLLTKTIGDQRVTDANPEGLRGLNLMRAMEQGALAMPPL